MTMLLLQVDHSGNILQMKWGFNEVMGSSICRNHPQTSYSLPSCIQSPRCKYSTHQFIEMLDPQLPHYNKESNSYVVHNNRDTLRRKQTSTTRHTPINTLEQPHLLENKDTKESSFIDDQDIKMKRSYNMAPYLSVSQSSRRAIRTSIQLVTKPSQMNNVKGIISFYTWSFVAIAVGIATIFQKSNMLSTSNVSMITCVKCNGYGITICEICKGKGVVKWEGKLTHIDPCPLCFGARTNKCDDCGGTRSRKDNPPFLQQYTNFNMRRP